VPLRHRVPSFLALRFHQLCLGIMAEIVGPTGLKTNEYGALTILDGEPGIEQRRLAALLGIDQVSAGQLVDRLERDDLAIRRPHPTDRRARSLFLTPEGLALRRQLQPAAIAAQDRILAPLRPEERLVLVELLTRIIEGHGVYVRPGNGRSRPRRKLAMPPPPQGAADGLQSPGRKTSSRRR
jgi:MarR family transcriptional regulator, temperature-dependent positive regulator of motility